MTDRWMSGAGTITRRDFLARLGAGATIATFGGIGISVHRADAKVYRGTIWDMVPAPVQVRPAGGAYRIGPGTRIYVDSPEAAGVAFYLAGILRPSAGYRIPVVVGKARGWKGGILLALSGAPPGVGEEGYRMQINPHGVAIRAGSPAGLFAGVQSLRQLLPVSVEGGAGRRGPWVVPAGHILDYPRFRYRGAMLDVARHFFSVEDVKRYIDEISMYKINHLHLHLTDDQGWRIMIDGWPRLATYGGSTEVGGGPGGYYTKEEYGEIVNYARSRFITIVPEIDMPGHTNAALASYAELNCDGKAPPLYTGTDVGFSSLCIDKELTYRFVEDVIREVSAMTPGPYLHIGGDESYSTSAQDYENFFERVIPLVQKYGKRPIGWQPSILTTTPPPSLVGQYWGTTSDDPDVTAATERGNEILLSPADHAYLDQKYNKSTRLGLNWAGYVSVKDSYNWDPGFYLEGVDEASVLGVEAPLWSETLETIGDIEYMAFPRLAAIAELGWSPASAHDWESFRKRLAAQGPLWDALGINYYRSPQIPWRSAHRAGSVRG